MKNISEQYILQDGMYNLLQLEKVLQLPHSHWMWLLEYEYAQSHCPGRKRETTFLSTSVCETVSRIYTFLYD